MNFPKLKHPRLCRILAYVVLLGCGLLPIVIVFSCPVPDIIKVIVLIASCCALLVYLLKNFMVLTMMDMVLAQLSCHRTARKQYTLPPHRSADTIRRSIARYGTKCDPAPIQPQPRTLRYKFSSPVTVYSSGIERVVAHYEVDMLDKDTYRAILRSAKTNSKALTGKKKAVFLDHVQKKQPLHRVTVVLILAHRIDAQLTYDLYKLVCAQCGDENENCTVPCVVDLTSHTCVFNCVRIPYIGYSYAVKNRGIRIIKRRVFGGNLNLKGNKHVLEPIQDLNSESSLWDLWKEFHHLLIGVDKETKKCFETMAEREIRTEDELLYLKWDQRGICQTVELDTGNKIAKIETVENWTYPKAQPVGKKIRQQMENHIAAYYTTRGYAVEFVDVEMLL